MPDSAAAANSTVADRRLAELLIDLEGIVAVALGGSRASGLADFGSDTDLYAFFRGSLAPATARHPALAALADPGSLRQDLTFGTEDHLTVDGGLVEVVYLDLDDLTHQVDAAYAVGLADEAFATAFLHTVATAQILRDPSGEIAALRDRLATYPAATRERLLGSLPPLLDTYLTHLAKAAHRGDLLSVQQRRASVQAVYFNLLFALNARLHPGEKRLLQHAEQCPLRPADHVRRWTRVCRLAADSPALQRELRTLVDDLVALTAVA